VQREKFDTRRRADDPIRKLYQTKIWRAVRRTVLARDPFCMMCIERDRREPGDQVLIAISTVVHHVIAARKYIDQHGGDVSFFYDDTNLEGVCKPDHDATTARECGFSPQAKNRA
jgi:5-methylcytosine-specific restriction protein A